MLCGVTIAVLPDSNRHPALVSGVGAEAFVEGHSIMKAPKHQTQRRVDDAKKVSAPQVGLRKMLQQVVFKMRPRKGAALGKHSHPASDTNLSRLKRYSASTLTTDDWRVAGFRDITGPLSTSISAVPTAAAEDSHPVDAPETSICSSRLPGSHSSTKDLGRKWQSRPCSLKRSKLVPMGPTGAAVLDMQRAIDAVMSSTGVIPVHKFVRPIKVCCGHHA